MLCIARTFGRIDDTPYAGPIIPDGRIWSVALRRYVPDIAILSLTTVPGREDVLRKTLISLVEQTVLVPVIVAIPRRSIRFATLPYTVPDWLRAMAGVHVIRCEDMGPATKILATVDFVASITNSSRVRIITVDDDLVSRRMRKCGRAPVRSEAAETRHVEGTCERACAQQGRIVKGIGETRAASEEDAPRQKGSAKTAAKAVKASCR